MAFNSIPGYRFNPTDEELVNHYLKLKILGYDQEVRRIAELNVCDFDPWELANYSATQSDVLAWHFFTPRVYKYSTSQRVNRVTRSGFWKVTGKHRNVLNEHKEETAVKKTLVFYEGRFPNAVKTCWVMHEYIPTFNLQNQRNFIVCKLKKKEVHMTEEGKSSSGMTPNFSHNPSQYQSSSYEDDLQLQAHLDFFQGYNEMDYSLNSALPLQSSSYVDYNSTFGYG